MRSLSAILLISLSACGTEECSVELCTTYFSDADQDGFGLSGDTQCLCEPESTWTAVEQGDCDDENALIFPGAEEICDMADTDCDGETDATQEWFVDEDGDGWGTDESVLHCELREGFAASKGDCDDQRAMVSPASQEHCNDVDDDCDPNTNEDGVISVFSSPQGAVWREDVTSLSRALIVAAGDLVRVCPGIYQTAVDYEGDVRIQGAGSDQTILQGDGTEPVLFLVWGDVALSGLSITGGGGALRAGGLSISTDGAVTGSDLHIYENEGTYGGGAFIEASGGFNLSDLLIEKNTSADYGGGIYLSGSGTLADLIVSENEANDGAGVATQGPGTVSISNATVKGNTARGWGGGFWNDGGAIELVDSSVQSNTAAAGGAFFLYGLSTTKIVFTNVDFGSSNLENTPADGMLGEGQSVSFTGLVSTTCVLGDGGCS